MPDSKVAQDSHHSASGPTAPMAQTSNTTGNPQGSASFAGKACISSAPMWNKSLTSHLQDLASKPPTRHAEPLSQSHEPPSSWHATAHKQALAAQGELPVLGSQSKLDTQVRKPGQEDEAGNKIHHKGVLGHILHWEHTGMNADE